jgi:spore maturation protein CgeB
VLFGENPAKAGYVDYHDVPEIYGRSKINLCLNNNMTGIDNIKGRNFEVPACRGFLLSGPAYGLEEYFEIGKEVIIYQNADDLADKITYYLRHDEEREKIAQTGYKRAMKDHTYEKRFKDVFSMLEVV